MSPASQGCHLLLRTVVHLGGVVEGRSQPRCVAPSVRQGGRAGRVRRGRHEARLLAPPHVDRGVLARQGGRDVLPGQADPVVDRRAPDPPGSRFRTPRSCHPGARSEVLPGPPVAQERLPPLGVWRMDRGVWRMDPGGPKNGPGGAGEWTGGSGESARGSRERFCAGIELQTHPPGRSTPAAPMAVGKCWRVCRFRNRGPPLRH